MLITPMEVGSGTVMAKPCGAESVVAKRLRVPSGAKRSIVLFPPLAAYRFPCESNAIPIGWSSPVAKVLKVPPVVYRLMEFSL